MGGGQPVHHHLLWGHLSAIDIPFTERRLALSPEKVAHATMSSDAPFAAKPAILHTLTPSNPPTTPTPATPPATLPTTEAERTLGLAHAPASPLVVPPDIDLVPGLLPRHTLSLLVGTSYVGKTALLLPALARYVSEGDLWGHPAARSPSGSLLCARVGYVVCDRTRDEVATRLHLMALPELDWRRFPFVSWQDCRRGESPTLSELYEEFDNPKPQLLVVEAIQTLMPSGKISDYREVMQFVAVTKRWCRDHDVTILGTTLSPKAKEDEGHYAPFDMALGAGAWSAGTASLLALELADPFSSGSTQRKLTILTRTSKPVIEYYDFNNAGHLVPTIRMDDWRDAMNKQAAALAPDELVTTAEVLEWGRSLGVSVRSAADWLAGAETEGRLEKVKKGTYRRPTKQ